jgi:hypothetical protein
MFPHKWWSWTNRIALPLRRGARRAPWTPRLEALEDRFMPSVTLGVENNVNISQLTGNQNEDAIAMDPMHPNRLFATANNDPTNAGLFTAYSTDGGATWTHQIVADGSDPNIDAACCDSQAIFDNFGNLYLTYLGNDLAPNILLSTDGGKTFTTLHNFQETIPSDQPHLAVGAGTVWLAFNDGNNMFAASGARIFGLGQIGPFSGVQEVPNSLNGNFGDIAIGPTGQVLVSYQDSTIAVGINSVFVSLDAQGLNGSFGNPTIATTTNVGSDDTALPAVSNNFGIDAEAKLVWDRGPSIHHGRVYLVYTDAPAVDSINTDNFVRFSDDNGATWSAPVRVSDNTGNNSKFMPSMVLDQVTGDIAVQWYDTRNDLGLGGPGDTNNGTPNDDAQLWATISVDGGQTFLPNIQVSTGTSNSADSEPPDNANHRPLGFGDYEKTDAFVNGIFYPVWSDNSNSTGDNPNGPLSKLDVYTAQVFVTHKLNPQPIIAVAPQAGGGPFVNVFDGKTNAYKFTIIAYETNFTGGVRVATGDVNGDGIPDIICAPGPGRAPEIRVFDGNTGALIQDFMAYDTIFQGGVWVAAGDVNNDGFSDIVTGPDAGGGPLIRVFSGKDDSLLRQFFAYTPAFFGGVRVAAGDVNGDGLADIIVGAGPGGGPHVKVYSGLDNRVLDSFFAFSPAFLGGVNVGVGFLDSRGREDIITGAGAGGAPVAEEWDGITGQLLHSVLANPFGALYFLDGVQYRGGVEVSSVDRAGTGFSTLVTGFGPGEEAIVQLYDQPQFVLSNAFFAFDPTVLTGVFVGGN